MTLFLAALLCLAGGGGLSLVPGISRRTESRLLTAFALAGCGAGLVSAFHALGGGAVPSMDIPWRIPGGDVSLVLDPLSSLFLALHFTVSGAAVLFGYSYFKSVEGERSLKALHFFFSTIILFTALTFASGNGILFLFSWEAMALSSFFLVGFEHEKKSVRKASYLYLVLTRVGTLCLFAVFLLLAQAAGSLQFSVIAGRPEILRVGSAVFLLALAGFGVKAGFMPFHVWLPEAHPAAPSPVSALLSGVVIKTGIYGLVRVLSFFPERPVWWGAMLIGVGIVSGILGVAWALAQHDFKRLLAYHSVENIGIIALGLGVGCLGQSLGFPAAALLGFAGGLAHVVNHGLFKSLLFLGAGSVLHGTGTAEMDRQGGLWKRMPWTGFAVVTGSVAICGLPPLNGFVSEWLVYSGAFRLILGGKHLAAFLVPPALALIGALALACFTKAFGIQFLGTARTTSAAEARESGPAMIVPMMALAGVCAFIGLFPTTVFPALIRAVGVLVPSMDPAVLRGSGSLLGWVGVSAWILIVLVVLLALFRRMLLRGKPVALSSTWACGFGAVTPRIQYTSSSFAQFPASLFRSILKPVVHALNPSGYFPDRAGFESHTPDAVLDRFIAEAGRGCRTVVRRARHLQHGRMQLYLAYGLLFLLVLLIWKISL